MISPRRGWRWATTLAAAAIGFATIGIGATASAADKSAGNAGKSAGKPAVELQTPSTLYQGRSLVHNRETCWLLDATGAVHEVPLGEVKSYRQIEAPFRPETPLEARDRWRKSLPASMEAVAKGKYVVCAPRGAAARYAELLDNACNSLWMHFSRRSMPLETPEFPLTAIIFPTRADFVAYAREEYPVVPKTLLGYYHRRTNRIALYADGKQTASASREPDFSEHERLLSGTERAGKRPVSVDRGGLLAVDTIPAGWNAAIDGDALATLVHEATHQVAYNVGLHARLGDTPRWVSEGLAMLLEEDSRRDDSGSRPITERLNRQRYLWFMNYRQTRRPAKALEPFLTSDDAFAAAALDAYSEAWALSFYLVETRRTKYSEYLKRLAARDPLAAGSPESRLEDFQAVFGRDVAWLEGQYLKFLDGIPLK